ncbi:MAG: hypothetical protein A2Y10_19005 [Planctomycetes bacterium GWF2_41_51]|nr:MAG: hypothetical protein A2Y10_19005 [Planctomycetes bacterium GWF2_41_51]HBG27394.1 hypothetical protein [Phycisphaerales bacterium]
MRKQISIASLLISMFLIITHLFPNYCEAEENKNVIAVVMDKEIFARDIEPNATVIEQNKNSMTPEKYNQWLKQYKESNLRMLIFSPLLEEYAKSNNLEATDKEIEDFSARMERTMAKEKIKWKLQRSKYLEEFENPDTNTIRKNELEKIIKSFNNLIEILLHDPNQNKSLIELRKRLIKNWKINKSLFDKYGGRVAFSQAGPVPLDAYNFFLQEQEKQGHFVFKEKPFAEMFWSNFLADHKCNFYYDANEANNIMKTPWWLKDNSKDTGKEEVQTVRWINEMTGEEIFNINDIVRFDWSKQIFELTFAKAIEFKTQSKSLATRFIVKKGEDILYPGFLTIAVSSINYNGRPYIMIDREILTEGVKPPLFQIDKAHSVPGENIIDLRFSEKLRKALEKTGKLAIIDTNSSNYTWMQEYMEFIITKNSEN